MNKYTRFNLSFSLSARAFLSIAHFFSKNEGTILLYSGGDFDSAKKSFLFLFPSQKCVINESLDPWQDLEKSIEKGKIWAGYLGYELGAFSDSEVKIPHFKSQEPIALFYQPNLIIEYDHQLQKIGCRFCSNPHFLFSQDAKHFKRLCSEKGWEGLLKELNECPKISLKAKLVFQSDDVKGYIKKIESIKEQIRLGNVYQLNLSQEFRFKSNSFDPYVIYRNIVDSNPAPFTAFLNCENFFILSSSPERFLTKRGLYLEARPIKGTSPRGSTVEEDIKSKQYLLQSEKERAELLMITDLMRNDLGKVCLPGSIVVEDLWRCEAYTNVFHLLSIIKGKVSETKSPIAILRDLFPGGSITGCPKIRAMQLICEFEGRCRGVYTGSIGYIDESGDFDFNIAIRTLTVYPRSDHFELRTNLGGGIVIDSDPQKEYEETLHKGKTLFSIIEH